MTSEVQPGPVAAVDLGSNSFHMVIARVVDGHLKVVDRMRERVQLASGLDPEGGLSPEAESRALACLQRFGQRLEPRNIRQSPPGFPFGSGLVTDGKLLCQLELGQVLLLPQLADHAARNIVVHFLHFLSPPA